MGSIVKPTMTAAIIAIVVAQSAAATALWFGVAAERRSIPIDSSRLSDPASLVSARRRRSAIQRQSSDATARDRALEHGSSPPVKRGVEECGLMRESVVDGIDVAPQCSDPQSLQADGELGRDADARITGPARFRRANSRTRNDTDQQLRLLNTR